MEVPLVLDQKSKAFDTPRWLWDRVGGRIQGRPGRNREGEVRAPGETQSVARVRLRSL
ncbi:unnamed protein product, partial [Nesidiocoris tenuis]